VHLLSNREKIGRALDDAPLDAQAEAVHGQGKRRKRLGHDDAVVGRIEIRDAQALELFRRLTDTLNLLASDERLVIFNLRER